MIHVIGTDLAFESDETVITVELDHKADVVAFAIFNPDSYSQLVFKALKAAGAPVTTNAEGRYDLSEGELYLKQNYHASKVTYIWRSTRE